MAPHFPLLVTPDTPAARAHLPPLLAAAQQLGDVLAALPDSREKALAWTALHESAMWAHQAVLRVGTEDARIVIAPASALGGH